MRHSRLRSTLHANLIVQAAMGAALLPACTWRVGEATRRTASGRMRANSSDDYCARLKRLASPKRHCVLLSPIGELKDDLAPRQQPALPTLSGLGKLEPIAFNLVGALFTPDLVFPVGVQDERWARAAATAPIHNQAGTLERNRGHGACPY